MELLTEQSTVLRLFFMNVFYRSDDLKLGAFEPKQSVLDGCVMEITEHQFSIISVLKMFEFFLNLGEY